MKQREKLMKGKNNLKEKILGDFARKNYNNKLEHILAKKDFSEDVKNSLLSIFYKIENGYLDYTTVKRDTFDKKEYIEELTKIIDKDCDKIEFTKNRNKQKIDRTSKKIVTVPIETNILYSIAKMPKRSVVVKYLDPKIEEAFSFLLNTGNNINIVEPLRDFNGFSWNIIVKEIEDINCNLIYQNIIYLMGNRFIYKWVNNYDSLVDYFELFQSKLQDKYGKNLTENVITNIIKLSLMLKANGDNKFAEEIKYKKEELEDEWYELENPTMYLVKITKMKKKNENKIKELNEKIYNKDLLMKEYERINKELPIEKKIFSIRILKNNLKDERQQLFREINELNELIHPEKFMERKKIIERKLKYFADLEEFNIRKTLINLQKQIIKCMMIDVQKAKNKQELIEIIYKYRYYQMLPISQNKTIKELKLLDKLGTNLFESIVKKAFEMNIIKRISKNDDEEYKILKELLLLKIISFEDINIKLINEKNEFYIMVYDENIEDCKIKIENLKKNDFNIKINKKTKLFN